MAAPVLGGIKGALAERAGFAALDTSCAPSRWGGYTVDAELSSITSTTLEVSGLMLTFAGGNFARGGPFGNRCACAT